MPQTFALAYYAIKIRSLEDREWEPLSNFSDGKDFLDFLESFFKELKSPSQNDAQQQLIRVTKLEEDDDNERRIYGIIETGQFGRESDIVDIKTHKTVHHKKTTEADMLPFYFMAEIPQGTDEGFLILQRSGNYGIRQFLSQMVTTKFEAENDDHSVVIFALAEAGDIARYQAGRIESIRFIRFKVSTDVTDCFDKGHQEEPGRIELVVYARRKHHLPLGERLHQFFSKNKSLPQLFALDEHNFKYDDIKVTSRVGSARRTVDLANPKKLRSYHDVTDSVTMTTAGHPKFESIHQQAELLMERIKEQTYGNGKN